MKKTTIDLAASTATVVFPAAPDGVADVVRELALPPYQAVLLLLGAANGLDAALLPRLTQLFGRGIARAALEAGAVVLDGGTQAGVMALMGAGMASRGGRTPLVGVAPAGLVAYPGSAATGPALEPNHSHFVLTEGTAWGAETPRLFQLVAALAMPAAGSPVGRVPALAVVVGGGATTTGEVVRAVRQRLPILVLAGTGGLADELAAAWPTRHDTLPDDPALAEILAEGTLSFYELSGSVPGLARLLVRELGTNQVLAQAWETFADYDFNATLQQRRFDRLQQAVIWLGLVGTALAIAQQLYAPQARQADGRSALLAPPELLRQGYQGWWMLHHLLLLVPIGLAVLVTATNRFKQGSKWLLLRAGAEAIKREIFRYRTRAADYQTNAESLLAQRIEAITRRLMRTEANTSSLVPYDKTRGFPPDAGDAHLGDNGFDYLTPDRYVALRLGNQFSFFRTKAVRLERQLKVLSWLTFVVGGVGTYLAAVGQQVWIALTTALVAALGAYLGYRQTESTLTKYNQAATDLANVRAWWHALPPDEQLRQANIDSLVAHTEQVLQVDLDGWVQQMQNTLAELHKAPPPAAEREEEKAPQKPVLATSPTPPAAVAAAPPAAPGPPATEPAASEEAPESEEALTADAELPADDVPEAAATEPAPAELSYAGLPNTIAAPSRNGRG